MPRGTKNNTSSKSVDLKEKGEEEADMLTELYLENKWFTSRSLQPRQ